MMADAKQVVLCSDGGFKRIVEVSERTECRRPYPARRTNVDNSGRTVNLCSNLFSPLLTTGTKFAPQVSMVSSSLQVLRSTTQQW